MAELAKLKTIVYIKNDCQHSHDQDVVDNDKKHEYQRRAGRLSWLVIKTAGSGDRDIAFERKAHAPITTR